MSACCHIPRRGTCLLRWPRYWRRGRMMARAGPGAACRGIRSDPIATVMQLMRRVPTADYRTGPGRGLWRRLLAACCASDVRYGAPSLKMNAAYIKIGLGGCDMGSSYFLPRLVGSSLASELILTGRFIHAERAEKYGLISEVVEEDKSAVTNRSRTGRRNARHRPHGPASLQRCAEPQYRRAKL